MQQNDVSSQMYFVVEGLLEVRVNVPRTEESEGITLAAEGTRGASAAPIGHD